MFLTTRSGRIALATLGAVSSLAASSLAKAQSNPPQNNALKGLDQAKHSLGQNPSEIPTVNAITGSGSSLLEVPLVKLTPGGVSIPEPMSNPMANQPGAAERGRGYFVNFNCVGCHAPNGGGGMGISLSNSFFKFGSDPSKIYLVISHGAPLGMPSWGGFLPDNVIWDLVSYVQSISKDPDSGSWGVTVSKTAGLPKVEQVPAEFNQSSDPWKKTEPFSYGQKPTEHAPTTGRTTPEIPGPAFGAKP